jgi:hypothetical protein
MIDGQARYAEVLALLARLYRALDLADGEALASCFADGAVWYRGGAEVTGTDALKAVVEDRPNDRVSLHAVSNLCLDADGNGLLARYFLTVSGSQGGEPARLIWILSCEDGLEDTDVGLRIISKRSTPHLVFSH